MDNFKAIIKGIKCDSCDWKDTNVEYKDYKKYINKPCPVCGANLLTRADYNNCKMIVRMTKILNLLPIPNSKDDSEDINVRIKMDGTGKMDFDFNQNEKNIR